MYNGGMEGNFDGTGSRAGGRYALVIAAAGFIMIFIGLGLGNAPTGLYIVPVTEGLGISRGAFSIVLSIRSISRSIASLFFGFACARFGLRNMIAFGMLLFAAAYLAFSRANGIALFYVSGVFWGMALAFCTTAAASTLVNNWFIEHRGLVLGIILGASGVGGSLFNILVTRCIAASGWRTAYGISAAVFLFVAVLLWLVLRERPGAAVAPAARKKHSERAARVAWEGFPVKALLRMPYFYAAALFAVFAGLLTNPVTTIAPAHIAASGFTVEFAAYAVSVMSLTMSFSKVFTGFLYDRCGLTVSLLLCLSMNIVGMLSLARLASPAMAFIFAVSMGLSLPVETLMIPLIVSELFGSRPYASLIGVFMALVAAGIIVGNPLMNFAFDLLGSYTPVLRVFTLLSTFALALMLWCVRRSKRYRARSPQPAPDAAQ